MDSSIHLDFSELTTSSQDATSNATMPVKYINCVPKIKLTKFETILVPVHQQPNAHYIMLVDSSQFQQVQKLLSSKGVAYVQQYEKLFYILDKHLNTLINEIIQTNGKYVYPMIFVNYIKRELNTNDKVNFDNSLLLYLRIWANQIREISAKYRIEVFNLDIPIKPSKSASTLLDDDGKPITPHDAIKYIGYKISCELLYYYKYVVNGNDRHH